MFRKAFLIILMCALLIGAAATGTPLAVLLLMGSLILLAFSNPSTRNEQQE
jgi:hypothetical protein